MTLKSVENEEKKELQERVRWHHLSIKKKVLSGDVSSLQKQWN